MYLTIIKHLCSDLSCEPYEIIIYHLPQKKRLERNSKNYQKLKNDLRFRCKQNLKYLNKEKNYGKTLLYYKT